MKAVVAVGDLVSMEDTTVLLYARLGFRSATNSIRVRYNAVARERLTPALLALRRRLAGQPLPIPRDASQDRPLPYKWENLLRNPQATLEEGAPAVSRFASVPGRRRNPDRCQLLVLNPFEMVHLFDPSDLVPYGVDSLIVPRSKLKGVQATVDGLEISAGDVRFVARMARPLVEAAVLWHRG